MVSVWRGFLFLWVLGMGYVILLWHSLSLPYNYFDGNEIVTLCIVSVCRITYLFDCQLCLCMTKLTESVNPLVTNGFSHPYQMGESISNLRGIRSNFSFLFNFSMKFVSANRIAPDGTPPFVVSHIGLFWLPMSHKKDDRLIRVNSYT